MSASHEMTSTEFVEVTELANAEVSNEQVLRVCRRYGWALSYCAEKDVLEVACGTGPGLGLLAATAHSLVAGDISESILAIAQAHYGTRVDLRRLDAAALPFADRSLDVVILFEALYYLPSAVAFVNECRRVLRSGGVVLISNANKDLIDFNPSPLSHTYHGVVELGELFGSAGFLTTFFGDVPVGEVSWRQRVLRPIKRLVIASGLMPKSMAGKRLLKRLVFGRLTSFPKEISREMLTDVGHPQPIAADRADTSHKVVLCAATMRH